jgi:hypothetical protein
MVVFTSNGQDQTRRVGLRVAPNPIPPANGLFLKRMGFVDP